MRTRTGSRYTHCIHGLVTGVGVEDFSTARGVDGSRSGSFPSPSSWGPGRGYQLSSRIVAIS